MHLKSKTIKEAHLSDKCVIISREQHIKKTESRLLDSSSRAIKVKHELHLMARTSFT